MDTVRKVADATEGRLPRFEYCCIPFRICGFIVALANLAVFAYAFSTTFSRSLIQRVIDGFHSGMERAIWISILWVLYLFMAPLVFGAILSLVIGLVKENETYLRIYVLVILLDFTVELIQFVIVFIFLPEFIVLTTYIKAMVFSMGLDILSALVVHSYRVSISRKVSFHEAIHYTTP